MPVNNVIIIHGCPPDEESAMDPNKRSYDKHWIPWLRAQLTSQGIKAETPLMPKPWEPNYQAFKSGFEKYFVDESTTLVGHSCGCAFLVQWLGDTKRKIDRLVLVAPWKITDTGDEARKYFYEFPIDETIKSRVNEIVMFTANNEEEDGKKSLKIYHDALGGKIFDLPGRGHYTMKAMGTEEFPELLKAVAR